MSFDMSPVQLTPATTGAAPASAAAGGVAGTAPKIPQEGAVTIDAIPPTPPPEVLDAMGTAAGAPARLASAGQEMRFKVNEATGKLSVEIHDLHGNLLFTVPSSKVLDVAGGGGLS